MLTLNIAYSVKARNFTPSSGTNDPAKLPDMMSLAASGRLQNAIKYCTKVHKMRVVGQRVE